MNLKKRKKLFSIQITVLLLFAFCGTACTQNQNSNNEFKDTTTNQNKSIMKENNQASLKIIDHSRKSILARGCDPQMSLHASKAIPPLIGNPAYVPTTNDLDFVEKLKSRKWSVIFFAPGACRYNAAGQSIPGANSHTEGWTLEEYRELIYQLQGDNVQIVETMDERETVTLLKKSLEKAKETN